MATGTPRQGQRRSRLTQRSHVGELRAAWRIWAETATDRLPLPRIVATATTAVALAATAAALTPDDHAQAVTLYLGDSGNVTPVPGATPAAGTFDPVPPAVGTSDGVPSSLGAGLNTPIGTGPGLFADIAVPSLFGTGFAPSTPAQPPAAPTPVISLTAPVVTAPAPPASVPGVTSTVTPTPGGGTGVSGGSPPDKATTVLPSVPPTPPAGNTVAAAPDVSPRAAGSSTPPVSIAFGSGAAINQDPDAWIVPPDPAAGRYGTPRLGDGTPGSSPWGNTPAERARRLDTSRAQTAFDGTLTGALDRIDAAGRSFPTVPSSPFGLTASSPELTTASDDPAPGVLRPQPDRTGTSKVDTSPVAEDTLPASRSFFGWPWFEAEDPVMALRSLQPVTAQLSELLLAGQATVDPAALERNPDAWVTPPNHAAFLSGAQQLGEPKLDENGGAWGATPAANLAAYRLYAQARQKEIGQAVLAQTAAFPNGAAVSGGTHLLPGGTGPFDPATAERVVVNVNNPERITSPMLGTAAVRYGNIPTGQNVTFASMLQNDTRRDGGSGPTGQAIEYQLVVHNPSGTALVRLTGLRGITVPDLRSGPGLSAYLNGKTAPPRDVEIPPGADGRGTTVVIPLDGKTAIAPDRYFQNVVEFTVAAQDGKNPVVVKLVPVRAGTTVTSSHEVPTLGTMTTASLRKTAPALLQQQPSTPAGGVVPVSPDRTYTTVLPAQASLPDQQFVIVDKDGTTQFRSDRADLSPDGRQATLTWNELRRTAEVPSIGMSTPVFRQLVTNADGTARVVPVAVDSIQHFQDPDGTRRADMFNYAPYGTTTVVPVTVKNTTDRPQVLKLAREVPKYVTSPGNATVKVVDHLAGTETPWQDVSVTPGNAAPLSRVTLAPGETKAFQVHEVLSAGAGAVQLSVRLDTNSPARLDTDSPAPPDQPAQR